MYIRIMCMSQRPEQSCRVNSKAVDPDRYSLEATQLSAVRARLENTSVRRSGVTDTVSCPARQQGECEWGRDTYALWLSGICNLAQRSSLLRVRPCAATELRPRLSVSLPSSLDRRPWGPRASSRLVPSTAVHRTPTRWASRLLQRGDRISQRDTKH